MEKEIKINGLKYLLLAQYRNLTKVKQYVDKYLEENFSIYITKSNNMQYIYGRVNE